MSATLEVTILGCGSSTGVPRLGGPDSAVRAWITEMDPHGFIRAGEIAADQLAAK